MVIYKHEDYKEAVLEWVQAMPKQGYGQFAKMAQALNVSSVFITQVLRGDRDFNADQALGIATYIGLSADETDYFLLLNQEARAATPQLKTWVKQKRKALKAQAIDLKKQIAQDTELSHEAKSTFYGHWHYSAIRLLTSIPGYESADKIADYFHLPLARVQEVLNFLSANQLIVKAKGGGWKMGPKITHLEADSPFVVSRQVQWRSKGFEIMSNRNPDNFFYTSPMSLDEKTFLEVREQMVEMIKAALEKVRDSDATMLACFNLDFFRM